MTLKNEVLHILDLIPLSTSSIAPAFSIAAAFGVMVFYSGTNSIMGVILLFIPFLISSLVFRSLNKHYPNAGASYHWGLRIIGRTFGGFQAWVVTLAYLFSIPPIVIPAGEYTIDFLVSIKLLGLKALNNTLLLFFISSFWIFLAILILILGTKPTAKFTEIFLGVELFIVISFIVIGIYYLPSHIINTFSYSWFFNLHPNITGLFLTMVVAATILDGWEIDSYAAEESKNPHEWPGLSGIIGLIFVMAIYLIVMPLMLIETPLVKLSNSADPLFLWSTAVIPKYSYIIDIAVIVSTASSLWLTSFILSRAWFAMSRNGLLPNFFSKTSPRGSPYLNILIIGMILFSINFLIVFSKSIFALFSVLLSTAGIFLLGEFMLDNITGLYFFWFGHNNFHSKYHIHWIYRILILFSASFIFFIIIISLYSDFELLIAFIVLLFPSMYFIYKSRSNYKATTI